MNRRHARAHGGTDSVPAPQGRVAGVPYDLRRPSVSKMRSRWWNPADARVFTPKTFGMGWGINLYRLLHPGHRDHEKVPRE